MHDQDYTSPNSGYSYGEIQMAIWTLLGFTLNPTRYRGSDLNADDAINPPVAGSDGTVNPADVSALVTAAQANNAFVPGWGQYVGLVIYPFATDNELFQPMITPVLTAGLGDSVWNDLNATGLQDEGPNAGIAGVTVKLLRDLNGDGDLLDASGYYDFQGLMPGLDYTVEFVQPTDYSSISPYQVGGALAGNNSDGLKSSTVILGEGIWNKTIDSGFCNKARLGDLLWYGSNGNGIQDSGEPGVSGQTVTLVGGGSDGLINGSGDTTTTTTTDYNGNYSFTGLNPGEQYQVTFSKPATTVFTTPDVSGNMLDATDSDANPATGVTPVVTLASNENNTSIDAGLYTPAQISGYVYEDKNNNGAVNGGEPPIFGVVLTLTGTDGAGNAVTGSATTDANGFYQFIGLPPGTYTVSEAQPSGYLDGKDTAGSAGGSTATNDVISGIVLTSGTDSTNNNFGELLPASLGNLLWLDSNGNGLQDSGEAGINGKVVTLISGGADGLISTTGDNTSATTTTATVAGIDGTYSFTGLTPGQEYQVQFGDIPAGTVFTTPDVSSNSLDATDSDANPATGKMPIVNLASGENNTTVDAGVIPAIDLQKSVLAVTDCPTGPIGAPIIDSNADTIPDSGINLGNLTKYLFFFADGSVKANWQGASNGMAGDVVVDGVQANETSSGGVPYAGTIYTNDTTLGAWQTKIVDENPGQANGVTGQTALVTGLETDLTNAFSQINGLTATAGYTSVSSTSLNGLNTQDGINNTYVINVTSGFSISSLINITGDAGDLFVLRWDTDANFANGYQGEVKFSSGGAIVPLGELTPANFVHVAGDLGSSGGGGTPPPPYPQGPTLNGGQGPLVGGADLFGNGGFFTGYWLSTGDPSDGKTGSFSNAIFVGGWYTSNTEFSMTSGTSGVHVCLDADQLTTFDPNNVGTDVATVAIGQELVYSYKVTNLSTGVLGVPTVTDNNATPGNASDDFTPQQVLKSPGINYGDSNSDGVFDAGESWYFRQSVSPTAAATLTNTATATSTGSFSDTDSASVVLDAASIGNHVWCDTNSNGIQDSGEPGVSGVTVELQDTAGKVLATTTTDTNGNYLFSGLWGGNYQVQVIKPTAYLGCSPPNQGGDDTVDSDVNSSTGISSPIALAAGEHDNSVDAGLTPKTAPPGPTPIAIDLNASGSIETVGIADSKGTFDLLGNGSKVSSGWLSKDDGFLAIDSNHNGKIDSINELFGGNQPGEGFAELIAFDSNGDLVVDVKDARFVDLSVWRDSNGNHKTDKGELMSLSKAGVVSLSLDYDADVSFWDAQGNLHLEQSSATLANGQVVDLTDIAFETAANDVGAAAASTLSAGYLFA